MGSVAQIQMALKVEHFPMSAIRSLKTAAFSLAAMVALTNGVATAGPPKGNGGGNGGNKTPNGGIKIDPKFSQGPKNGGIKIDPQFGQGPKNGGIKIDPGKGNGNGPKNGGIKIDPGFGNGMGAKGVKQGDKPWMQKPMNGKNMIYCKNPCDLQYCFKFGVKKSFGYCYHGIDHCHWYCNKWSPIHNCWFYFDQSCLLWYYWCEPDLCYYPVTYLPYRTYVYVATPVVLTTPVVVAPVVTPVVTPVLTTTPVVTTTTTSVAAANVVAGGAAQAPVANPAPINLPPLPGE